MTGVSRRIYPLPHIIIILITSLLLSSCFEVKQDISIGGEGEGEAKVEIAMEKVFASDFFPDFKRKLPSGWHLVGERERNGKQVLTIERKFQNLSELSDSDMRYSFSTEKTGFMKKTYSVNITTLKTSDMPFPYTLTMKVPGSIEETSGTKVSSDTVRWEMQGFRRNTVLSVSSKSLALPDVSRFIPSIKSFFLSLMVKERVACLYYSLVNDKPNVVIYYLNDNGKLITKNELKDVWPFAMSPDGREIVYITSTGDDSSIYKRNVKDNKVTCLISSHSEKHSPRWSVDGKQIGFIAKQDGKYYPHLMHSDGSGVRRLTSGFSEIVACGWSPDTKHLAILINQDGKFCLNVMDSNGINIYKIVSSDVIPFTWSPNSKKIAYYLTKNVYSHDLYVMDLGGGKQTKLISDRSDGIGFSWAPDSNKIALISLSAAVMKANIYVIDVDGNNTKLITTESSSSTVLRWAPDGRKIGFAGLDGVINVLDTVQGGVKHLFSDLDNAGHCLYLLWISDPRIPFLSVKSANTVALVASILTLLFPVAGAGLVTKKLLKRRVSPVRVEASQAFQFCTQCGTEVPKESLYCVNCGTKI